MLVRFLFFFIFFMTFFAGLLIKSGMPGNFTILSEFAVILLLILSLISRAGKGVHLTVISNLFTLYILITIFSSLLNGITFIRPIESIRLIFRFYFFYLAIYWLEPNDAFLKRINNILLIFILLQFPIIGIKFIELGIRERTIGGWINTGHVTAVLWPSFIFYCASYYFLYKRKKFFLIVAVCSVLASIVGAKRLIFYIYPVQFIVIYHYLYSSVSGKNFSKKILTFSIVFLLIVGVSSSIMHLNESLNPDKQTGGEVDLQYAFEYSKSYLVGVTADGYSFGRLETTMRVFKILYDSGICNIFFGVGPGVTTPPSFGDKKIKTMFEERFDEFKINYGLTPMARIALEYGLLGVFPFAWMVFYFSIISWRLYNYETDPYWKAFAGGSVWFAFYTVFLFFAYHHGVFWGYTMPALYFYAMAVVSIRYNKIFGRQVKQYDTNIAEYPKEEFARR